MYDPRLYEKSEEITFLIEALWFLGNNVYDTLRQNPFLREDDYIPTIQSFPSPKKGLKEFEQDFLNLETKYKDKVTPAKKKK